MGPRYAVALAEGVVALARDRQGPRHTGAVTKRRVDPFAVVAVVLALVMTGVYLRVIESQEGDPALWYVGMLVVGAAAAGVGALRTAPHRRLVLLGAGLLLGAAGVLGLLTIGLPVLVAGGLSIVSATRAEVGVEQGQRGR
jgi:hypothetical protein